MHSSIRSATHSTRWRLPSRAKVWSTRLLPSAAGSPIRRAIIRHGSLYRPVHEALFQLSTPLRFVAIGDKPRSVMWVNVWVQRRLQITAELRRMTPLSKKLAGATYLAPRGHRRMSALTRDARHVLFRRGFSLVVWKKLRSKYLYVAGRETMPPAVASANRS
jgi:hypothetical protein